MLLAVFEVLIASIVLVLLLVELGKMVDAVLDEELLGKSCLGESAIVASYNPGCVEHVFGKGESPPAESKNCSGSKSHRGE